MINEGLSNIVYHFTHLFTLLKILENNQLYLKPSFHSESEKKYSKNRLFFLSTTRSRSEGYFIDSVRLTLDGEKLNQKYKGFSMNYWDATSTSSKSPSQKKYNPELEDRLVSNKPIIDNANKYILKIDVYVKANHKWIPYANELAKELNIPIFFYKDKNAFTLSQTNKSISLFPNNKVKPENEESDESLGYAGINIISIIFSDKIDKLNELDISPEEKNKIKDNINKIKNKSWDYDFHSLSKNIKAIYGSKKNISINILSWLSEDMVKNKTYKFEDYVNKKIN